MSMSLLFDPGMLIVLAMRLLGPLMIFRWPLLGTLLSQYVFDMFDVVIWDATGTLAKIDYTAFDKLLDMYQLTIQLIVALKWKQKNPRQIAAWLFGYRFIGFILYEMTRNRILFLIFPNLFFVFFLAYLICLRIKKSYWFDDKRSLAIILIVICLIKIPQEYALHYAQISPWLLIKNFWRSG